MHSITAEAQIITNPQNGIFFHGMTREQALRRHREKLEGDPREDEEVYLRDEIWKEEIDGEVRRGPLTFEGLHYAKYSPHG